MSASQQGHESDEPVPASLWKWLDLPELRGSDAEAPQVEREVLLKLARKELSPGAARAAYLLIDAFESWKKAFAEIVIEEFRRKRPPPSQPPED